jgi:putative endonuclease
MHYVYLLRSIPHPDEVYVGLTDDVRRRLEGHNAGRSPHTAKHRPWEVVAFVGLASRELGVRFESYLKSGSGRAFRARHFLADSAAPQDAILLHGR